MIDTHVHFWDYSLNIYDWVINTHRDDLKQNYLLEDYLLNFPKPLAIITIEASNNADTLKETQWIEQYIVNNAYGIKIKHMPYIDVFQAPENFNQQLSRFKPYPFICGFRHIVKDNVSAQYLQENLTVLKENSYIFDCQASQEQLLKLKNYILNSKIKCVIDHAKPIQGFEGTTLYFKITEYDSDLISKMQQYLSPQQLLLGSNYPVSKSDISKFPEALILQCDINAKLLFNL